MMKIARIALLFILAAGLAPAEAAPSFSGSIAVYGVDELERAAFIAQGCATNHRDGVNGVLINLRPYRGRTIRVSVAGVDTYLEDSYGIPRGKQEVIVFQRPCGPTSLEAGTQAGTAESGRPLEFRATGDYVDITQQTKEHAGQHVTVLVV